MNERKGVVKGAVTAAFAAWAAALLLWALPALVSLAQCRAATALPAPAQVSVGTYVNNVQDVNFKDGKLTMDFYVWFRWKDDDRLASYQPLDSMELINGKIETRGSVVNKTDHGVHYASVRITAIVYKTWDIDRFPFDQHSIAVHLEDSTFDARKLEFVADAKNSRLGNEVALAGWLFSSFNITVTPKVYDTNYGELGTKEGVGSTYSRASFFVGMQRDGIGPAFKLLTTVCIATLVAFLAFGVKPSDVDPRFGLGVGSLFAVAASAFVVASTVPDSSVLTIADKVHILAMWLIFASLVQSAFCLRWDEAGRDVLYQRVDAWSLILFPLAFGLATVWIISRAFT
jgi:hypothetical protein